MKVKLLLLLLFFNHFLQSLIGKKNNTINNGLPEKIVVDTLYGHKVEDSYRYIENISDTTAINWYKKQKKITLNTISKITNRDAILNLQNELGDKNKVRIYDLQITNNDYYFYLKKQGKIKCLYYKEQFKGEEQLLFNPEEFKPEYSINYINPSWDGSKIAIGLTKNDLEIGITIVINVSRKTLYPEIITNSWPSGLGGVNWLPDNYHFTYTSVPFTDKNSKDYLLSTKTLLHKLNSSIEKDIVLFSKNNNKDISIKAEDFPLIDIKKENSKYLFGRIAGASYYSDYYYSPIEDVEKSSIKWKHLFKKEDLIRQFYIKENDIIFLTAKNAEHFKICKTSLLNPDFDNPDILVPEDSKVIITDFTITENGIFFVKTKNGVEAKLYQLDSNQNIKNISIPSKSGYINVFSKGDAYSDLWIETRGWASEKMLYKYDDINKLFVNHQLFEKVGYKALLANTVVEEIEVMSHDGEKIPLSIIYKEGMKLDGNNPLLMRGYGALGYTLKASANSYLLHWINNGGVYAVAHVRGGGEKGNAWYKGGYKATKPNTWKDFIACTEYLIENKYTSNKRTAVYSASGGGIMVGRAITERPDLFAVAMVRVGIFNTLRSEFAPNGKNLTKEFGTVKDSIEYGYLAEMDAYHKIKKGVKYPAVFLTGGINDSRVAVWQPAKFAAKLQRSTSSKKPVLLSVNFDGGHGFDASSETANEELANLLSFALWQTGHPDYQLKE